MTNDQSIVVIDIIGRYVYIDCKAAPKLVSGSHKLFFTSIIEFTLVNGENVGFRKFLDGNSGKRLEEVIDYLKSNGIEFKIGPAANGLLNSRKIAGQELNDAIEAGKLIHQTDLFLHPDISGFKRILKPYQLAAVAHMTAVGHSANFSVPGSGKTTMVLAAYAQLRKILNIEKLLIVGPRSCFSPWEEEFNGCFERSPYSVRLSGTPSQRMAYYDEASNSNTDLVLVTYQTATNDAERLSVFLSKHRTMMVLDESHYINAYLAESGQKHCSI